MELRFRAVICIAALCVPTPGVEGRSRLREVVRKGTTEGGASKVENGAMSAWGQLRAQSRDVYDLQPSADAPSSYSTIGEHPSAWSSSGGGGWDYSGGGEGGWNNHKVVHPHPHLSVSAVFQMSLTALAFLAFAGFLLHLVVLAGKGHKDSGPTTTTMAPTAEALVLVPFKRPKADDARWAELTRRIAEATEGPL